MNLNSISFWFTVDCPKERTRNGRTSRKPTPPSGRPNGPRDSSPGLGIALPWVSPSPSPPRPVRAREPSPIHHAAPTPPPGWMRPSPAPLQGAPMLVVHTFPRASAAGGVLSPGLESMPPLGAMHLMLAGSPRCRASCDLASPSDRPNGPRDPKTGREFIYPLGSTHRTPADNHPYRKSRHLAPPSGRPKGPQDSSPGLGTALPWVARSPTAPRPEGAQEASPSLHPSTT